MAGVSDLQKINVFTSRVMKEGLKPFLRVGIFRESRTDDLHGVAQSFWTLALGSALSFTLSYDLIFVLQGSDWSSLIFLGVGLGFAWFVGLIALHVVIAYSFDLGPRGQNINPS